MKWILLALISSFCICALAASAPWYRWINVVNRTIICAQTSPGDAWIMMDEQPYMESRCKKPGNPR